MAVINTGLTVPGIRSEFFQRIADSQGAYKDLATKITSNTKTQNYRWLGQVAMPRAWGNGRLARGLRDEAYDITDQKYESTMEIDREEIEDDQTGQIRIRMQELAVRHESFKDYLVALLLATGGAAGSLAYNGQPFFSQFHPFGQATDAPGVQSNDLTKSAATGTTPTVQEFLEAYNDAVTALLNMKDDQGHPVAVSDSGLLVVVPPALRGTAKSALSAQVINSTSNVFAGEAKVLTFPWLTNAAEMFVLKTDGVVRPFIFQSRTPIEFEEHGPGSTHTFMKDRILVGTRERFAIAYGRYEYAVRMTFT